MSTPWPQYAVGASTGQSNKRTSTISQRMSATQVISRLIAHNCMDITNTLDLSTFDNHPISQGGFSDVYRGYLWGAERSQVAVKALRISSQDLDPEHLKNAARELHTWSKCKHINVVPLLGLAVFRGRIGMVSPWMSKGSLPRYIKDTPEADRHSLCTQICEGLSYLHQIGITHGDLKGDNVLVSDEGIPALTDFGNSILTNASMKLTRSNGQSSSTAMTLRWSAAEIIQGSSQTEASDVYALGMTILEVITEKFPYDGKADATVMFLVVLQKEPPARPENMPLGRNDADELWKLLLRCWAYDPALRPTAVDVTDAMKLINPPSAISSGMSTNHIVQALVSHGCVDLTHLLHARAHPPVGGIDDVFMSNLTDGRTVLVKREKIPLKENSIGGKALKRLARELYVWSKCDHPNILHAVGIADCDGQLAVVFPWALSMEILPRYLSANQQADRYLLAYQIASGVAYLHRSGIIHDSIAGANVVVLGGYSPRAMLAGFDRAVVRDNVTFSFTTTSAFPSTGLRWMAPEIIEERTGPTTQADIYSLGMTILECITKAQPYPELRDIAVLLSAVKGVHPKRPVAIHHNEGGDRLWMLLTGCWSKEPSSRPTAVQVESELSQIISYRLARRRPRRGL